MDERRRKMLSSFSPVPVDRARSDLEERLKSALAFASNALLAERTPNGYWEGELSSSALSTATAVIALSIVAKNSTPKNQAGCPQVEPLKEPIDRGLNWLASHVNADGGWGDSVQSLSNLSTTALVWAAFGVVPGRDQQHRELMTRAEACLAAQSEKLFLSRNASPPGSASKLNNGESDDRRITPSRLAAAIVARYGKDRTFSVPILTACALAGRLGRGRDAWSQVLPLPFELAAFPRRWFATLRLPVVSYALPALIAIGQARHFHCPSRNPLVWLVRQITRQRTLAILSEIQPSSGGFLEATPLTSFVVMSLASSGQEAHPVTRNGLDFLLRAERGDGSWPIDSNLATWVTTLATDALSRQKPSIATSSLDGESSDWRPKVCQWLLSQQYRREHAYTLAAPGGWAWTDLPGGVPDADDTAGAVLALARTQELQLGIAQSGSSPQAAHPPEVLRAAQAGIEWLLQLQNRDGGMPTFCRGWGALPFDRSSADITAHAVRCWLAWLDWLPQSTHQRILNAVRRAIHFLVVRQRADGAWAPLWFGNQFSPSEENLTYGTSRVVAALSEVTARNEIARGPVAAAHAAGVSWLVRAQNTDGGWGGSREVVSSVEETALALDALASIPDELELKEQIQPAVRTALHRGLDWLLHRVENGAWKQPTPIGFYFAKLWYYEKLYPQIFTVAALGRAVKQAPSLTKSNR